jgi:hypothetical protein
MTFPAGVPIPSDVMYMRFMKNEIVVRVAKTDTHGGLVLALYPSDKPGILYGEAFHEVDDASSRREIRKSKIRDKIWLQLLEGIPVKKILKDYTLCDRDCYYFYQGRDLERRLNSPTFNIEEAEESD